MAASSRDVLALPVVETEPTARSGDRWRRRLAVALAIVAVLEALGLLALGSRGDPRFLLELNFVTIGFFGTIVLFAVVGAFIVSGLFGDALPEIALLPLMVAFVAVPGSTAGV